MFWEGAAGYGALVKSLPILEPGRMVATVVASFLGDLLDVYVQSDKVDGRRGQIRLADSKRTHGVFWRVCRS